MTPYLEEMRQSCRLSASPSRLSPRPWVPGLSVPRPLPAPPDDPNLREEWGRDWSRLYETFLEVEEKKGAKKHTEPT